MLFFYVCIVLSARILEWSKKDGFYTSFQVTGGLWPTGKRYRILNTSDSGSEGHPCSLAPPYPDIPCRDLTVVPVRAPGSIEI